MNSKLDISIKELSVISRRVLIIFLLLIPLTLNSQTSFEFSDFSFKWLNPIDKYVELKINFKITNIGNKTEKVEEIEGIYLYCKPSEIMSEIILIEKSDNLNYEIKPGEEIYSYLKYRVPKNADSIILKFEVEYGGGTKFITYSYEKENKEKNIKIYATITIGKQKWMLKNLDVDEFRNGDPIPEAKTKKEWKEAGKNKQPAWCYYDNDPSNGEKYGRLYNWYAVNDPRGLAPESWHIPSDAEWTQLTDYLGRTAGKKMKNMRGWPSNSICTNESGFSGLPGGRRDESGSFYSIDVNGFWWGSTETSINYAWFLGLYYLSDGAGVFDCSKYYGLSVRCVRD